MEDPMEDRMVVQRVDPMEDRSEDRLVGHLEDRLVGHLVDRTVDLWVDPMEDRSEDRLVAQRVDPMETHSEDCLEDPRAGQRVDRTEGWMGAVVVLPRSQVLALAGLQEAQVVPQVEDLGQAFHQRMAR